MLDLVSPVQQPHNCRRVLPSLQMTEVGGELANRRFKVERQTAVAVVRREAELAAELVSDERGPGQMRLRHGQALEAMRDRVSNGDETIGGCPQWLAWLHGDAQCWIGHWLARLPGDPHIGGRVLRDRRGLVGWILRHRVVPSCSHRPDCHSTDVVVPAMWSVCCASLGSIERQLGAAHQ